MLLESRKAAKPRCLPAGQQVPASGISLQQSTWHLIPVPQPLLEDVQTQTRSDTPAQPHTHACPLLPISTFPPAPAVPRCDRGSCHPHLSHMVCNLNTQFQHHRGCARVLMDSHTHPGPRGVPARMGTSPGSRTVPLPYTQTQAALAPLSPNVPKQ